MVENAKKISVDSAYVHVYKGKLIQKKPVKLASFYQPDINAALVNNEKGADEKAKQNTALHRKAVSVLTLFISAVKHELKQARIYKLK